MPDCALLNIILMHLPTDTAMLATHTLAALVLMLAVLGLRRWPWCYAMQIWPGTLTHELLHFLVGLMMGAKPVSLSVIPRKQSDGG